MKTLWLLRHAKAASGGESLPDSERPLARRGQEEAAQLGAYLSTRSEVPDLVLCSAARRTRETLAALEAASEHSWRSSCERDLYLASAGELFGRIQDADDALDSLMVLAHNPGVGDLGLKLAERGKKDTLLRLRRGFVPCALAELRMDADHWRDLRLGCELMSFVAPEDLAAPRA